MSGRTRDFRPGRDRADERQPPSKIRKQNAYSGTEQHRSDSRAWSDFEENHSEYPSHGNRYVQQKDDRRKFERDKSPPGFDRWADQNKSSHSPSDNWDPPPRGKGMSQGRSRSRERRMSRSRSRGRATSPSRGRERERSRSPFAAHRRVSYATVDRSGSAMMMSSQPCKYFAAGMCRKGSHCTFFHPDNFENNLEQPRRRGSRSDYNNRDEGLDFNDNYDRGGNRDYDLKRQQPIRSGICMDFANGKCRRDNCRFSHDDPTADDRRGRNHDERTKSWNGPTWDDHNSKTSDSVKTGGGWGERVHDDPMVKDSFGTGKSTGWGERSVSNPRFHDRDLTDVENRGDDRRRKYPNEKSKVWDGPTWDDAKDTSDASKTTGWGTKLEDPPAADDDKWGRHLDKKNESWYEVKDTSDAAKSTSWGGGESSVVMNMKLHDHDHDRQIEKKIDDKWVSNLDDKTKPEIFPPTIDDTPKAFHDPTALNKESSQSQSVKQNLTPESGPVQTSVGGGLFENSRNIVMIEDFDAVDEVKVSDQNGESTSDDSGVRVISSSNGHNNIDLNEVPSQNMNNPEIEAETLPKVTGKQAAASKQENVVNPKVDNNQEQENVNNNTSKEEKAMKLFKIALVELVKEILKPKWKEGQMSRDVHKTIVKKTVDKVSGTITGDQVPNTQDKITHYLSISKPKINKLIQAYVDRFSKTTTTT